MKYINLSDLVLKNKISTTINGGCFFFAFVCFLCVIFLWLYLLIYYSLCFLKIDVLVFSHILRKHINHTSFFEIIKKFNAF